MSIASRTYRSRNSTLKIFSKWEAIAVAAEDCTGMIIGFPLLFYVIYTIFSLPKPMKTFHKCIVFTCVSLIPYCGLNFVYELFLIGWLDIPETIAWYMYAVVIILVQLTEVSMTFVCLHFRSLVMFSCKKDKYLFALEIIVFVAFFASLGYSKIRTDTRIFFHISNIIRCLEAFVLFAIMLFCFYQIKNRPTKHFSPNSLKSHAKMVYYLLLELSFQCFMVFRLAFRAVAYDENSFAYDFYYDVILIPLHTIAIWRGLLFCHVVKIAKTAAQTRIKMARPKVIAYRRKNDPKKRTMEVRPPFRV